MQTVPGLQSAGMRICSLLPSATEIVADLGLIDALVGVSEECRWPGEVVGKPIVSVASIDPAELSSREIDDAVRMSLRDGRSLYAVDSGLVEELAPDVILTQDLCAACAVSSGDLASACPVGAEIVSLDPQTLADVADSVRMLGARLGVTARGEKIAAAMLGPSSGPQPPSGGCLAAGSSSPSGSTRRSAPGTGFRRWSSAPAGTT